MSKKHLKSNLAKASPESQQDVLIRQGKMAFNRRDYSQAIAIWENARAIGASEKQERITRAVAEAHFRLGQLHLPKSSETAIRYLTYAAMFCERDALYAYHVGLALHRQHKPAEALVWYQRTLHRDPQFKRAALPMAIALIETGQDAVASPAWALLDEIQRAYCRREAGADSLSKGLKLFELGDWQAAKTLLLKAQTEPYPPMALGLMNVYLGLIAQRENQPGQALEAWRKALDAGLQTDALLYNLLLAYTLKAEAALAAHQLGEAAAFSARGLEIAPENPRLIELRAQAGLQLGYAAATAGDWQTALKLWEPLPDLSGPNARGLAANRAIAFERTGALVKAAEAWRDFVRRRSRKEDSETYMSPLQVARLWMRISALYLKAGQPDDAIQTLQNALKYQPDDPEVSLVLAKTLADVERYEAAHKQLERTLQANPKHIETLVFKAEFVESGVGSRYGLLGGLDRIPLMGMPRGMSEWETVLATGDETYAPVAREHLVDLYGDYIQGQKFWDSKNASKIAQELVEKMPDAHFLRALYVDTLLISGKGQKPNRKNLELARQQIALIDLSDLDALHHLIDVWHTVENHPEAVGLLELANAKQPLDAQFYIGIANCALEREQTSIALGYYEEAIRRAPDPQTKGVVVIDIALQLITNGQSAVALRYVTDLQKEMPNFGLVYVPLAMLEMEKGNQKRAKDHVHRAERWAKKEKHPEFLEFIRYLKAAISGALPPGMGPADFLSGDVEAEDFEDEDELGPPGFFDVDEALDNQPNYAPESDSRRRRQNRQNRQKGSSS